MFHIPEEVHLVLPNQDDTMHKRPARKIGLYTRFFDFTNFRLPLSSFLVDILRHFRINISQLSVIGAAKVYHFEILCRVYEIVPTIRLFWCFYVNTKKSGWISFRKRSDNVDHTAKHVIRDLAPVVSDFNAQDYATLISHPSPTVGRTVPLLPVAPDHTDSELKASVERLFDEGGSDNQVEQGDFARGRLNANIHPVVEAVNIVTEDAALVQLRRQGKRKFVAMNRFLAGAVLNAEVVVTVIPTLPFVTASVSTTPEREDEDHTDSVAEPNHCTIRALQRFVISSDSSHHSGLTITEAEVDSLVRSSTHVMTTATIVTSMVDSTLVAKEKPVKPSLFVADSSLAGGADPNTSVFSDLTKSDFLSMTNESRLDDGRVCHEMVDEFAPPKFFASIHGMEHDQLFTEFNVGAARQMSLSEEVRMRAKYNVKERRRLKSVVEKQDELRKAMYGDIENLKAQLLLKEAEAVEATHLCAQTSNLEVVEKSLQDEVNALKGRNVILEKERDALDVKVTGLEASVVGKERDLTDLNAQLTSVKSQNDSLADQEVSSVELRGKITVYDNCMEQLEKFQDDRMKHLLNIIPDRRWLLTHGLKLFLVKCLNSSEYLIALGAAISRAIEKGMQSDLVTDIDHGREGKSLADVDAYNPDTEADFNISLQQLCEVDCPLLAELKSYKDASTKDIMNVLCLEGALADAPGMNDLQPDIDFIPPISIDDYEIAGVDGQEGVRESCFSSRSPNLYALFPSAFLTSYGPSHLSPSFLVSSAWLASLLRYTRASSFGTGSTFVVRIVGMSISIGMTASVSYVNENRVSPLLDFIMDIVHLMWSYAPWPKERVSFVRYLKIGVIYVSSSSSTTANTSTLLIDFSINSSTNTCLLKCAKLVDAILLSASSFLFSLLGICLIENALKLLEDPSVNKIHGSGSSSSTSIRVSRESSSGRLTMKSASICPLTDTLVLKNGKDFSADLAKNLFRLASFPFKFCTSFKHFKDGRLKTASTLSGHTFSPLVLTLYPKNIPSSIPKNALSTRRWIPSKNIYVTLEYTTQLVPAFLGVSPGPETNAHSSETNLLLFKVITPPSTGSFNETACSFLTPGLPIIPLYGDGDLTTTKFIQAEAECSSSPILTTSCICPIGHIILPLNTIKGVGTGTNCFLISGRSLLKQCSYIIFEARSLSTYMRFMQWPSISASMIIGPSTPSSSFRGGESVGISLYVTTLTKLPLVVIVSYTRARLGFRFWVGLICYDPIGLILSRKYFSGHILWTIVVILCGPMVSMVAAVFKTKIE
nr:transposase (putative), gypsy type [Tanacetum cinerariifolium]GEX37462.1 transposase (putative), gypsy type [Tanacetum cinerariifolium]